MLEGIKSHAIYRKAHTNTHKHTPLISFSEPPCIQTTCLNQSLPCHQLMCNTKEKKSVMDGWTEADREGSVEKGKEEKMDVARVLCYC